MDCYLLLVLLIHTCAGTTAFSMYMTIDITPSYAIVVPGSTVQVHCIVNTTSPTSITYKWFTASNGPISHDNNKFKLFDNGTIEINDFNQQDQGQYYCTASNDLGSIKSLQTELERAFINDVGQTQDTINFQPNQHLELMCSVPQSIPKAEVSWYNGPSLVVSSNRIGFTLNNSLVFSYCEDDDVGPWECRVKNSLIGGMEQTSNSYLLKQTNPSLSTSQTAQIIAGPVGQMVIAGGSFELQCIAIGRPPPEYTWLKDGSILQQDSRITFSQNSQILKITNTEMSDAGSYSCSVVQTVPVATAMLSELASIVVKDPPIIISPTNESPVSHTQYASLSVSLSCTSNGTLPITWSWFKNATIIKESDNIQIIDSISNGVTESILEIQSLSHSNGGVLQCIATNDVTGSDQATLLLTVNTTFPVISLQPTNDVLVFVGTNITLPFTCEAYPHPTITWIEDSETLTLQQKHSIDDSSPFSGTLTITPVTTSDSGVYSCSCSNSEGNLNSKGVIVTTIDKPDVIVKPVDALVSFGDDILVSCTIDSYSNTQITVQHIWKRDFTDLMLSDRIQLFPGGTLLITQFEADDIGYYECVISISNSASDADPLLYEIGGAFITEDPPSRPSPPTNLDIGTITSESVSISWEEPLDNGGLQILGYIIEVTNHGRHDCVFDQNSNITTNATLTQLMVALHPYSRYSVAVYAFNSMGNSIAIEEMDTFWTLEEEPSVAPAVIYSKQGDNVGELTTTWDHPPCQERNGRIVNYIIKLESSVESIVTTPDNLTSWTIGQLKALQDYTVQVSAVTSIGSGPFSVPLMARTVLASVPDVPRNLMTSQMTATSVHISWDSPEPRENEPLNDLTVVTYYVVYYNDNEINNVTNANYTAVNLLTGSSIEFSVAGVNSFGRGDSLSLLITLPTESPSIVPSPSVTDDEIAFYQEVWFPAFAGGIAGGILMAVVLIFLLICVISYCCRKNDKRNRSFSSNHTSASAHSLTYPHRKSTVLDKMMQVESLESPVPDNSDIRTRLETTDDSGNGQDSGSICTMTPSQSNSTLRSKYQYRSPMEQEEYQRLSDFRKSTSSVKSDIVRTKVKMDANHRKKPGMFKGAPHATNGFLYLTRETSPTDTVSSFEYQSQSQTIAQMRNNKRLPSYTTDGYDTSSEDDSVFHSTRGHSQSTHQKHRHKSVTRNSSFKVQVDSKKPPNLALMTALPQSSGPPFMPTAIPLTPQPLDPSPSTKLGNHMQQFSRLPRLQSASDERRNHVDLRQQQSTFV